MGDSGDGVPLRFDATEVRGALEVHGRGLRGDLPLQVLEVEPSRRRVVVHPSEPDVAGQLRRWADGLDDGPAVRAHRPREEHLAPPGQPDGHPDGEARRGRPVVGGEAHHLHLQQLPHHALELEEGLPLPQVRVRPRPVGGDELHPTRDLGADRGHVVLPTPGPQEVEVRLARRVLREDARHVPVQRLFGGEGRWQVQRSPEAQPFRDDREQLLHVGDAERRQHRLAGLRHRVRDVRVPFHR
jgi:hypothetical protein